MSVNPSFFSLSSLYDTMQEDKICIMFQVVTLQFSKELYLMGTQISPALFDFYVLYYSWDF